MPIVKGMSKRLFRIDQLAGLLISGDERREAREVRRK
jgi:hypothetical protein